jgi:hypothetical protein
MAALAMQRVPNRASRTVWASWLHFDVNVARFHSLRPTVLVAQWQSKTRLDDPAVHLEPREILRVPLLILV